MASAVMPRRRATLRRANTGRSTSFESCLDRADSAGTADVLLAAAQISPDPSMLTRSGCGVVSPGGEESASMDLEHYTVHEQIGRGTFGAVFRAVDRRTETVVAVKVPKNRRAGKSLEGIAGQGLRHENIAALLEVVVANDVLFLVYEMVRGQDLLDWLHDHCVSDAAGNVLRYTCSARDMRAISVHVARALAHCHASGVAHRDVKPENIMVTQGAGAGAAGALAAKLIDFGLAHCTTAANRGCSAVRVGSIDYAAPELFVDVGPVDTKATDVWSYGVLLYVLHAHNLPPLLRLGRDDKFVFHSFKGCPADISRNAARAIDRCLVIEPAGRVSMRRLLRRSWFKMDE
jgi:serine/threonine protein kinase